MYVQVNCRKNDCQYNSEPFCIELDAGVVVVDGVAREAAFDVVPDVENKIEKKIRRMNIENDYIVEKCPNGHKNRFKVNEIKNNEAC